MRLLVQRVLKGSVCVDGETVGAIDKGYVVFCGVSDEDDLDIMEKMTTKLLNLRIFEDENGKVNKSIIDVGGEILLISQFTLYADCHHGNRPSFVLAGAPDHAKDIYEKMAENIRNQGFKCDTGIFGADMKVELINDGPFTIWLDSQEIVKKR